MVKLVKNFVFLMMMMMMKKRKNLKTEMMMMLSQRKSQETRLLFRLNLIRSLVLSEMLVSMLLALLSLY